MTDAVLQILIVEDEPAHAEAVRRQLLSALPKIEVRVAGSLHDYHEAIDACRPDIVLFDWLLPDGRALEVLASPPESGPFPILVMTSHGDEQIAVEALKAGALDYVVKSPTAFAEMPHTISRALREWKELIDRKSAEEARRESEERFRQLAETAGEWIWEVDASGLYTYSNPVIETILGYKPEEIVGKKHFYDLFHPEDGEAMKSEALEGWAAKRPFCEFLNRNLDKSGQTRWLSTSGLPMLDKMGNVRGYRGTNRDITERRQAEEALRSSAAQLSNALQMARAGHWEYDVGRDVFTFNDNFYRIFRTTAAAVGGYQMSSADYAKRFCHPDDAGVVAEESRAAIEATDPDYTRQIEHRILYADGEVGTITVRFFIAKDAHGRTVKTYGVNQDITERKRMEERLQETLQRLRQAITSTINVLSHAVEARDPYTAGHQRRTTVLAEAIAGELGLSPEKIECLHMAGLVHDIGKISIPAEILSKPAKPTRLEYALLKTHAQRGYEILKSADFPWPLAEIVQQHHERMDGSGYPRGLRGDQIFVESRILAVADTMEAMSSHRPYRPALGTEAALEEIERNRGVTYDPEVVAACLELFRKKGFRFPD